MTRNGKIFHRIQDGHPVKESGSSEPREKYETKERSWVAFFDDAKIKRNQEEEDDAWGVFRRCPDEESDSRQKQGTEMEGSSAIPKTFDGIVHR
jgi:hypothetical protein